MSAIPIRPAAVRGAVLILCLFSARAAWAAPLTLGDALEYAAAQAPALAARDAARASARALVTAADALPDPKLVVGIDNLPIEGRGSFALDRDFMTMERIGVMQEVPNQAKRRARRARADATVNVAEAEARVALLHVLRDASVAWIDVHYAEQRLASFDALDAENELLAETVAALIVSASVSPADAIEPQAEAVRLADRRDALVQEIIIARARLRRYIADAADQPLAGDVPDFALNHVHVSDRLHTHPELTVYAARSRQAQAELSAAVAEKRPDWGVEVAYQHREAGADMVTVQLSIDLPLFGATRQEPRILAQQHQLRQIDAETDALLREHGAELESQLAEHARLGRSLTRYTDALIPLANERAELTLAAYRAGKGDLQEVIRSRTTLVEMRLEAIAVENAERALGARIHFAYQETLP